MSGYHYEYRHDNKNVHVGYGHYENRNVTTSVAVPNAPNDQQVKAMTEGFTKLGEASVPVLKDLGMFYVLSLGSVVELVDNFGTSIGTSMRKGQWVPMKENNCWNTLTGENQEAKK